MGPNDPTQQPDPNAPVVPPVDQGGMPPAGMPGDAPMTPPAEMPGSEMPQTPPEAPVNDGNTNPGGTGGVA